MSDRDTVMFTADIAVASREVLRRRGLDPNRAPTPTAWHRQHRLGTLLSEGYDRWWILTGDMSDGEVERQAEEIVTALTQQALPYVAQFTTDRGLLNALARERRWLSPHELSLLIDLEAMARESEREDD
jgi:hypothetical protein